MSGFEPNPIHKGGSGFGRGSGLEADLNKKANSVATHLKAKDVNFIVNRKMTATVFSSTVAGQDIV